MRGINTGPLSEHQTSLLQVMITETSLLSVIESIAGICINMSELEDEPDPDYWTRASHALDDAILDNIG